MEFYYDFNSKQVVNPLDKITKFFINPLMMEGWKTLRLGDKIDSINCDIVIQEKTGLPIIMLPIELLNLKQCKVKLRDDGSIIIYTTMGNSSLRLYVKPTSMVDVVRIDTVLVTGGVFYL
jgi:hypothetical protein